MEFTDNVRFENLRILSNKNRRYIKSGCSVQSNGGMDIIVNSGIIYFGQTEVAVTSTPLTIDTADTTYNRLDLVIVDNQGLVSISKGTPAELPKSNNIDIEDYIILARVKVLANTTQITDNDITDLRTINTRTTVDEHADDITLEENKNIISIKDWAFSFTKYDHTLLNNGYVYYFPISEGESETLHLYKKK